MNDRDLAVMVKRASTDMEKRALWGKLLFGGLMLAPVLQGLLKQQQVKAHTRGATAMSNMLLPALYAQGPQGALGMPDVYRQRFGLQPISNQ